MKAQQLLHYGYLRLLMQRPVQRFLYSFGHELQPERWIFVLGCYNSATTLLASVLARHPQIGGLVNEGAFHTDALPYPEQYGWPRMWSMCLEEMRVAGGPEGARRAARIKRQWSLLYPRGVPNLIEKSIANITRTAFLQEFFQPAYFIHIVRNGYVVAKGIQQKTNYRRWNSPYRRGGYPIEMCAGQWRLSDEVISRDGKGLERLHTLRYEDLVTDPAGRLREITDFLGLPPMPAGVLEKEWQIHEVNSAIVNMNPAGLKRLSPADFASIEAVAGDTLKKYGYSRNG